jgi:tRNA(Ile)-lysidine synthase TilS/MesJ
MEKEIFDEVYGDCSKEDLIGRIIELECSIKWFLDECKESDLEYGKVKIRKMLKLFPKNLDGRNT